MKTDKEAFAERLKTARKKAGLSQYELSRRSGVSRVIIAQCEAGKVMRPKGLERMAKELGVSPGWLAFGDDRVDKISKTGLELAYAWEHLSLDQKQAIWTMVKSMKKE